MARRPARDSAVGALFALALIVLALGVMAVGGEVPWLSKKKATYRIVFPEAGGLLLGAPVRIAGVDVGTVSGIHLPLDPAEQGIEVSVAINQDYGGRVREDSRAAQRILQLLTNEKFVEITPGSLNSPQLPPGSEIELLDEIGYIEQGEAIADDLREITASLKNILNTLEQGQGLAGKVLTDPEFGLAGVEALGGAAKNIEALTADLRAGKGAAGRLLYDEKLAAKFDDLGRAIEDFASLTHWLSEQRTELEPLLSRDGSLQQTLLDLRESAGSLRRFGGRLDADEGLMNEMLRGAECAGMLSRDICTTFRNTAEITSKINQGDGTLGALVNERELHDAAADFLGGVNDSKFAQWLNRHYRKKGILAAEEAEKAAKAKAAEDAKKAEEQAGQDEE